MGSDGDMLPPFPELLRNEQRDQAAHCDGHQHLERPGVLLYELPVLAEEISRKDQDRIPDEASQ